MKLLIKIKNILLKFWAWIMHFFIKKRNIKRKIIKNKKNKFMIDKKFNLLVNRDEEMENIILAVYPGVFAKELENINKKMDEIRKKIIGYNDEKIEEELNSLDEICGMINKDNILVSNVDQLNDTIDATIYNEELHLDTNEKINMLKDNLTELFDEKLEDYEEHIVKKAYYEYEKVNYVIVTTMLIDELTEELEKVYEKYSKNHYDKKTFIDKIVEIERKLEHLEKINNREEVEHEIESLKNDIYTKRKDKYDLLYNNEIFINIQNQCDELLKQVEIKEEQEKITKVQKQKEAEEKRAKKEEKKKEQEKTKEEKQEEQKEEKKMEDNILKRFMDLELARQIILKRELERIKKGKNEDVVKNTLKSYQEFVIGDEHEFNFLRNKIKLEVVKLYNDILRNICVLDDGPFIPIEHINIKLSDVVQETIDNQQRLNNLIIEKKKVNLEDSEVSLSVNQKLNDVLEKEKKIEKTNDKEKVLVKIYKPISVNDNDRV